MARNQKAGILAYKLVHFVLSTDRLIMLSSKVLKKYILNVNNSFPGPLITWTFEKQVPVLLQAAYMDLFCASLYAHTILVELSVNSFGCFFSSDIVAKQLLYASTLPDF